MRIDNDQFDSFNSSNSRSPVYVIELAFDDANTDLHYLTSHQVNNLTGNIINDTLKSISSTSQKISPEKAISTIGSISFECLDVGLTDLQRDKLQAGAGLKGKRVRVFKGFVGLDWSDYALIQTQIISKNISFKDGVYKFQCSDVQRVLRKNIFDVKETALAGTLTRTTTTVNVFDTSQFEMVKQPPSSSGITDAPGQTVGYLKIENDDQIEIIRYTGKTATSFTGCTRGVLGTRPIEVEANANDSDRSTKVEEYVYLEMPAVMLAYAIFTGVIYGQVEGLPDHWHLGVPAEFIRTSDFENIGADWFDTTDFDKGVPAVIRGVTKTDGKKFIEEEFLVMLGAFSPIYTNGEIGIRRLSPIIGDGGYGVLLNEDNIIKYGDLKHDLDSVINKIIIGWNYVESRGGFTRRSVLIDPESVSKHGESDPLELNLRALESSRHSYSTIKNRFDALRERYAGPPLLLQLTLAPTMNALEVGDIVRVELDQIQDFTQDGASLGRTFEVQRVQQNWINGEVKVDLFGSSDVATAVPEEDPDTVIVNSFYNSVGTEINATNFPGQVSSSNGITTITGTISLNGTGNPNDAGSVYFCNEDLTLNAGATMLLSNSPQLRVNGFFQVNGKIDGKGRGFEGGDGVLAPSTWGTSAINSDISLQYRTAANKETIGWPNPRQVLQAGAKFIPGSYQGNQSIDVAPEIPGEYSAGSIWGNSAPTLNLQFNGTDAIEGLVPELRASSGAGGNCCSLWDNATLWPTGSATQIRGSDGGASGCGIIIICKGADIGANGVVDTSGEDADAPATVNLTTYPWATVKGSSGAGGAAAAVYWLIDGVTSNPPNLNAQNSLAFNGAAKDYVYPGDWDADWYRPPISGGFAQPSFPARHRRAVFQSNPNKTVSSFYHGNRLQRLNAYQSLHKVQFVTGIIDPDNDIDVYSDEATFTLSEVLNTPKTSAGDRSTIEVAITPPASDDTYSYSIVEYRKQGTSTWTEASPSKFESTFEVKSDGSIYEVRLRSVSKSGQASPSGDVQTITTTNISGRTDAELAAIYPLQTVTGLQLDEGGTDFTGLGPNFEWDDDNNQLVYFSHYEVKIFDDSSNLLRTEKSVNPAYTYSVDKNRTDYKAQTTNDGFYTTVEIQVKAVSRYVNNLGNLYAGSSASFSVDASTTNDPNNLRFYVIPSKTSDLTDDANLGSTADWSNINDDDGGRPEDNATNGATWEGNITGQPDRQNVLNNLVDISDWESGGAIPSSLSTEGYGYADANSLIVGQGPFDFDEVVWQVKPQSASFDDGGFSFKNNVLINPAKVYRVSCWFRASSLNGTLRFSPSNSSRVRTLDTDTVQAAPYQHVAATPVAGKWYLVVMVIHPHNTTRISNSGMSGIYDPDTGDIVSVFDEFKFVPAAEYVRANFQYIDVGNTTDYAWFSRPRLETIDGSEQRLSALLGTPPDFYLEVNKSLAMVNVRDDGVKLTGPSNISVSKVSTGRYRVTHNSGYSGKGIVVSARSSTIRSTAISSETSNAFDVFLYNSAGTATDSAFTLIIDPEYR